jgi:hypothetical protein
MKLQAAVAMMMMVFATMSSGCSSGDSPGSTSSSGGAGNTGTSGGSSGTGGKVGGSGGAGGGETCSKVTPCGGEVVGTWEAKSSCLKQSGTADISYLGLACLTAQINGSIEVTGTLTLGDDGKYTDKTVAKGNDSWALDAACLNLSGTKVTCEGISSVFAVTLAGYGYEDFKCVDASSGGGCTCQGTINSPGGLGLLYNDLTPSGKYTSADNTLSLGDGLEYSYCVKGSELTVTPNPGNLNSTPYTGTVVLQNSGGGTGGAGGSGGTSGRGGSSGTGAAGGTTTTTGGKGGGSGGSTSVGSGGSTGVGSGGSTGVRSGGTTGTSSGGAMAKGGATGGGAGGTTTGTGGATSSSGGSTGTPKEGPCDIYQAASMPCTAAYSMVRVLSKSYTGPLFQVRAGSSSNNNTMSGGTTKDIMPGPDGIVDSATVDAACAGTPAYCTVSVLYDHSGNGNHIKRAQKGNTAGGASGALDDYESIATKGKVTVGGHSVYSLFMNKVEGYRSTGAGKNMVTGNKPQGTYELADGTRKASACCWDFGNVTYNPATEWAFMDTLCLGHTFWGNSGDANWFGYGADFEGGVWAGGSKDGDPGWGALSGTHTTNTKNPTMSAAKFALGFLRVNSTTYAIRVADLTKDSALTTAYDGGIPQGVTVGHKGGIVLGVGGDNSNNSSGTFYEGAMVAGFPTNDIEAQIMANIKAAGYAP